MDSGNGQDKPIIAFSETQRKNSQAHAGSPRSEAGKGSPRATPKPGGYFFRNKSAKASNPMASGREPVKRRSNDVESEATSAAANGLEFGGNNIDRTNSNRSAETGTGAFNGRGRGRRGRSKQRAGSGADPNDPKAQFQGRKGSAFKSNSTIATVQTNYTGYTGKSAGTKATAKNAKIRIRKKVGPWEKLMGYSKLLFSLFLVGAVAGTQWFCWASEKGAKNICDFSDQDLAINYGQVLPFAAVVIVVDVFAFTILLGFQNMDRGCIRGPGALQVKPESKITNVFCSFWLVEAAALLFHISYMVIAFNILITPVKVVAIIAIVASIFLVAYKSSRYKRYINFLDKKKLVGASCFLLGAEDVIFTCIQFIVAIDLFDDVIRPDDDGNETDSGDDGLIEGAELIKSESFYVFAVFVSLAIMITRIGYIAGHICCANPIFRHEIRREEVIDEEGIGYNILTLIPQDVRQELRVRIEKEGLWAILAYAILPGIISIVIVGLFIAALVVDLSQPALDDDSIFKEDFLKIILCVISGILLILSVVVYLGFGSWTQGCCVPPNTHHIVPKKERALFSMRGLEIADFITDIGSTALIFKSFDVDRFWQVIMLVSLFLTLVLNLYYYSIKKKDDHKSYQGKKKKIALSIALLAVEDTFMLPINTIFVFGQPDDFLKIELAAVIIAALTGAALFFIRCWSILYHICCGRPIYTGDLQFKDI